jgi:hypothetical protein
MHPALKRILRDCVPLAHCAEVRVTREMMDYENVPGQIEKFVRNGLARSLAKHIVHNTNPTIEQRENPEDTTTCFRAVFQALSPAELETLIIMAFEEGRKSMPAAPSWRWSDAVAQIPPTKFEIPEELTKFEIPEELMRYKEDKWKW